MFFFGGGGLIDSLLVCTLLGEVWRAWNPGWNVACRISRAAHLHNHGPRASEVVAVGHWEGGG